MLPTRNLKAPEFISSGARLIHQTGQGNVQAYGELYDRYSCHLYSMVLCMLKNNHDAEEVIQKVFSNIWEKAAFYDEAEGKPLIWLITIARAETMSHLRGLKRQDLLPVEDVLSRGASMLAAR